LRHNLRAYLPQSFRRYPLCAAYRKIRAVHFGKLKQFVEQAVCAPAVFFNRGQLRRLRFPAKQLRITLYA
jgi:hypothetical protein